MSPPPVDGWRNWIGALLPPRCMLCRAPSRHHALCRGCADTLPWIGKPCRGCALPLPHEEVDCCADCARSGPLFDRAWAAFRLAPPIQGMIHQLKYAGHFAAASMLGQLAATRLAKRPEPLPQVLIPVPLHAGRIRTRGYNQASELGRSIVELLAMPMRPALARRIRATSDQIGQSATQRRHNLRGAFEASPAMRGLHVALLDDVMTTGATLAELARACRKAGAAKVEAWAIARAL